jgi:cobalt transporter subunit CbtA
MRRVIVTALASGLIAGLAFFAVQAWRVLPLIRAAEVYETAAPAPRDATQAADHQPDHDHAGAGWEPAEGFERLAYTALADVVSGVGFAMLLVGAFSLRDRPMTLRRGVLWGLAGYAAFALAPALVLPPEPPGTIAAALGQRQAWWLGTAIATAAGLALIAFARRKLAKLGGIGLIALPHALGALHPMSLPGAVPPALAAEFVAASLAATAAFWLTLGAASGWLYPRLGR